MRILVTGGAGFLGGHVASDLLDAGHEVTVHDIAIADGPHLRGVRSIRGSLLDQESLVSACGGVEAICHLGGVGDVIVAGKDPGLAAAANVVETREARKRAKMGWLVRFTWS